MKGWFLALGGFTTLALLAPRVYTEIVFRPRVTAAPDAPAAPVAIVFGAGLWRNGTPTPVLYDRVATAVELYQLGKAKRLLMSGDGQTNNETNVMRQTALALGVPDSAIQLDPAGLDTYATCSRAKTVFGVGRALLVTQNFHLPRALFICEALGLKVTGVSADRRAYRRGSEAWWNFREVFATANAWAKINAQVTMRNAQLNLVP